MSLPQVDEVYVAVGRLAEGLEVVDVESISIANVSGRVLSKALFADRDSPALDVSAMDGYAIRLADVAKKTLPVVETTCAGSPPTELKPGSAVRVFTGAAVPATSECVIKREDTVESESSISLRLAPEDIKPNQNIRRKGENSRLGSEVLPSGTMVSPSAIAAVASFGEKQLDVHRRVRVTILNTGDEIAHAGQAVNDWQIRDSNGPTLDTWLASLPWVEIVGRRHVGDNLEVVEDAIALAVAESDAVLLTGGVSMGDTDYVPAAIDALGGDTIFHRLPIRPGRPVLGARLNGKLILGLPGNPVSVAVTSRVIGLPLLAKLAGMSKHAQLMPSVEIADPDEKKLHLTWYRLVDLCEDGKIRYSTSKGSGDLVSLSRSWGFVEVPAGRSGSGPWPLVRW